LVKKPWSFNKKRKNKSCCWLSTYSSSDSSFYSIYWVLIEMVELRQTPFLYLPDLSMKDPYFILPLIMGASMWFQQRLNPPPADPIQAKIMMMLPVVFTVFFLWFPSGLVLYWVTNNVLSITQQVYINKKLMVNK
jgi:protein translocase subunit yidC